MNGSLAAALAVGLLVFTYSLATAESPSVGTAELSAPRGPAAEGAGTSAPLGNTEENARSALEKAGYTQVQDIRSSSEGVSAKAMKNGKEVSLVIDSSGKIMERQR